MESLTPTILVHIGYHKTGTTWLQKEIFNAKNERFESIAKSDQDKQHLAYQFVQDTEGYLLSSFVLNTTNIRSSLAKRLASKRNLASKIFVLSSERLSGNPHTGGFDAKLIAHRLKAGIPQAKIFLVIREQRSFLLSNYFQYLSQGGVFGIQKYLNSKKDPRGAVFSPQHINYALLIEEYQGLFGKKNVLVLPYELFKKEPRKFLTALSQFIGQPIEIPAERLRFYHNKKKHHFVRYHCRGLRLFTHSNAINNFSFFYNKYFKYLIYVVERVLERVIPAKLDSITQKKLARIIEHWCGNRYVHANKKTSELIGLDLSIYGYY